MQYVYIIAILGVLFGFIALIHYLPQEVEDVSDEARQLITQYTKSGEYIGFDVQELPPVTKYVYEPVEKVITKILSNGTQVTETKTEYVQKEATQNLTTTIGLSVQDRVSNQPLVCKLGQHCDITGTIILVDPATKQKIPPPIPYSLTIDCDYRDDCSVISRSVTDATFPDNSFKYTFVTANPPYTLGEYRATVYVSSHYTNEDNEQERRIATRVIEVVP